MIKDIKKGREDIFQQKKCNSNQMYQEHKKKVTFVFYTPNLSSNENFSSRLKTEMEFQHLFFNWQKK